MTTSCNAKGVAIGGVVAALNADPKRARELVPERLHRYLDEPILTSSWYPIEDYLELLQLLAATVDPKVVGGDPYRSFGIVAARRDLQGSQDSIPKEQRLPSAGVYRGIQAYGKTLAGVIRRCIQVQQLYFSAGRYTAKRTGERTLRILLEEFPLVSAAFCAQATGYLTEMFRSAKIGARLEKRSCRARGQTQCAWDLSFSDTVDVTELSAFE